MSFIKEFISKKINSRRAQKPSNSQSVIMMESDTLGMTVIEEK